MTGYAKKFDVNATMSFTINAKQLLKKYNQICKKVGKLLNIEFDSKYVYGDDDDDDDDDDDNKCIKTKVKICAGCVITSFQKKKMPKEKASCKCLSIIMLDSVIEIKKKYYP